MARGRVEPFKRCAAERSGALFPRGLADVSTIFSQTNGPPPYFQPRRARSRDASRRETSANVHRRPSIPPSEAPATGLLNQGHCARRASNFSRDEKDAAAASTMTCAERAQVGGPLHGDWPSAFPFGDPLRRGLRTWRRRRRRRAPPRSLRPRAPKLALADGVARFFRQHGLLRGRGGRAGRVAR